MKALEKILFTRKEIANSLSKGGFATKLKTGIALSLQSVSAGCNIMFLYLLAKLPQITSNQEDHVNTDKDAVNHMIYMAAVLTGSVLSASVSRLITNFLKNEYSNELSSRIITKYSELDYDYTITNPPGEFVRRINQAYELGDAVSIWIDELYQIYLELSIANIALFVLDWEVGLLFLGTQFLSLGTVCYGSKNISNIYSAAQQTGFMTFGKLISRIQNHESIRLFNRVEIERADGIADVKAFGNGYVALGAITERNGLILGFTGLIYAITVISFEIKEVNKGNMSFSYFFPILIYLAQTPRMVDRSTRGVTRLLICEAGMSSINEFLDLPKEIKEPEAPLEMKIESPSASLEFKNIDFDYKGEPVLAGASFIVPRGSHTALVGFSGTGKTTAARLAVRSYLPTNGSILIDGRNINTISDHDLCDIIALVPQQPKFPNKPLIAILKEAKLDAQPGELIAILKKVQLGEFAGKLSERLGEGGAKWSGGQLQRLALAKALLKKPKIIIFDEATSALDMETALDVLTMLERETKGITTITISHNILSIRNADNIIVMENGQIIQQGDFDQLKTQKDLRFYKLLNKFCSINGIDINAIQSKSAEPASRAPSSEHPTVGLLDEKERITTNPSIPKSTSSYTRDAFLVGLSHGSSSTLSSSSSSSHRNELQEPLLPAASIKDSLTYGSTTFG